jgi:gliding motility-associated-like protein
MKKGLLILLMLTSSVGLFAAHIAGGELHYQYIGSSGDLDRYRVTMRLFRECTSTGPRLESETVYVGAYSQSTNQLKNAVILPLIGTLNTIKIQDNIPCLVGSPDVCYQVAIYSSEIDLPRSPDGYTLAWARCCRANGLMNAPGQLGATYITKIPGTNVLGNATNSSPEFVVKDTALVCGGNDFLLDFGASDSDGDVLTYAFCDAYVGGSTTNQNAPPPNSLSLTPLPYGAPYSGAQPLGPTVKIDPVTGIISGIAPKAPGRYVVNVCVTEWRNGVAISQHRKDFILKVGDCDIISAKLSPEYVNCDSLTQKFQNEANSSQIRSYFWDFGVAGATNDTSNVPNPSFTYPDTGTYNVTLIINRNEECSDTATAKVKIYPGFKPGFRIDGSCYQAPFNFFDTTKAAYGTVNSWRWDFGDLNLSNDTSRLQNPTYKYASAGGRVITLTVGSSKGCSAVIQKVFDVLEKPLILLEFNDTLICSIDSVKLKAAGKGSFTWTPNYNIIGANTATPTVYPKDSTVYRVKMLDGACSNEDSVRVNVIKVLKVQLEADTAICQTDSIQLRVNSPALSYSWSPSAGLSDPNVKSPKAAPFTTTQYTVTANLGNCQDKDSITIRVSPYPTANAGRDTALCFGEKLPLFGIVIGQSFAWNPTASMQNPGTLNPVIAPSKTTSYILTATGRGECPKSVSDTIEVKVIPPVQAFAGNDTSISLGEPLVLNATGGEKYSWSPETFLSDPNSANPTAVFGNNVDSIRYRVRVTTVEGCVGEDEVKVVVFKTGPQIFMPDAFTPNRDGRNDVLYPVLVGMRQLEFFRIYNRYGQLVFNTSQVNKAWDGTFGGKEQPSGTFIFMAQAINYKGETVFRKGTVLLIR